MTSHEITHGKRRWAQWKYLKRSTPDVLVIVVSVVAYHIDLAWLAVAGLVAAQVVDMWARAMSDAAFDDMSELAQYATDLAKWRSP